jgi:hypothetical protein
VGDGCGTEGNTELIVIREDILRAIIINVLNEGNPFSTIEWEFYSGFSDINNINREDFASVVIGSAKKAAEGAGELDGQR